MGQKDFWTPIGKYICTRIQYFGKYVGDKFWHKINGGEYRMGNQKWKIQGNW